MPHIHTGPGEHDHTASAIIIRTDGDQPRLLLHMHKKLGHLLQLGGHIELNETPWQAVLHEITEESGYLPSQLRLLQPRLRIKKLDRTVVHPQPVVHATHAFSSIDHNHIDILYAFVTNEEPAQAPGNGESTDLRWLTKREIQNLPEDIIYKDTIETCEYILESIISEWEAVPLSDYQS